MTSPFRHPAVHSRTVWWVECTHCAVESFNGDVPTFASEDELWMVMLTLFGWTRRDDGRVLCPLHTAVADCDAWGHELTEWMEHPLEPEIEWRYCARCASSLEQRVVLSRG